MMDLHLGKYSRSIWEKQSLLVVIGDFKEVLVSKKLYEERFKITSFTGEQQKEMNLLMAAAGLAAVSLADRESWGWTLTLAGKPYGLFVGVEPEGMICATGRPAQTGRNAVYLQRQKAKAPLVESHFEPNSPNVVAAVQRYFEQVEQTRTRIAVLESGKGVLLQALPGGDFGELDMLTDDELIEKCSGLASSGELKEMNEVVQFYECRCNDDMILKMVKAFSKEQQEELFDGEPELKIDCPRCGREYRVLSK